MFSWGISPQGGPAPRPLVVAHRGFSRRAPENTLAAFRMAIAAGADAFELDARLTSDRKVMVIHDRSLARTTGGRGKISQTASSVIRRHSAGAWFSPEFVDEPVPFLEEVLDLAAGHTGVNIELKFDSRREDPAALVGRVVTILRDFPHTKNILVSSFHHGSLTLLKTSYPEAGVGVLVYPPGCPTTSGVKRAGGLGAGWLIYSGGNIRKSFVGKAHERGLRVLEYTVNGKLRLARAMSMNVDGVITDDPGGVIRLLGRTPDPPKKKGS